MCRVTKAGKTGKLESITFHGISYFCPLNEKELFKNILWWTTFVFRHTFRLIIIGLVNRLRNMEWMRSGLVMRHTTTFIRSLWHLSPIITGRWFAQLRTAFTCYGLFYPQVWQNWWDRLTQWVLAWNGSKAPQGFQYRRLKPKIWAGSGRSRKWKRYLKKPDWCRKGNPVRNIWKSRSFAKSGYPLIAKPDSGVGAANTYKIDDEKGLKDFFLTKPAVDYLIEEFIQGDIFSFDGLQINQVNWFFIPPWRMKKVWWKWFMKIPMFTIIRWEISCRFGRSRQKNPYSLRCEGAVFFILNFFVSMKPAGLSPRSEHQAAGDLHGYVQFCFWYQCLRYVGGHDYEPWLTVDFTRKYHVCFVSRKWKYEYQFTMRSFWRNIMILSFFTTGWMISFQEQWVITVTCCEVLI